MNLTRRHLRGSSLGAANAKPSGAATVAAMKAMPTLDEAFGPGSIRADRGALFPAFLFQAKAHGDMHGQRDLLNLVATNPADQAWRPLSEGACSLVRA